MTPLLLALLTGCGAAEPAETWADCTEPMCRHALLEQTWAASPQQVLDSLPGLDEQEQVMMVSLLLRSHPDQTATICAGMSPDSAAGQECSRVEARPHLSNGLLQPITAMGSRAGGGPSQNTLPPPRTEPPSWLGDATARASSALEGCAPLSPCVRERAGVAALTNIELAGAICYAGAGEHDRKFYLDCVFDAAESLSASAGASGWAQAARLCNAAENFVHGCLHHTVSLVIPDVPPADRPDIASIEEVRRAVATVSAAVGGHALGELYADRIWSQWTWHAYAHAETVSGTLIPLLPPQALPHIRVAAAARMLRGADWSTSLPALADALADALAVVDAPVTTPARRYEVGYKKVSGFWPQDNPQEGSIPATYCAGDGRRPVAKDARIDLQLAILEAAGRQEHRPPASFFAAVIQSDAEEWVRWTAARILAGLYPQDAAALSLSAPSPLIESRLR